MILAADVDELTDDQRTTIRTMLEANPEIGNKQALRAVGIRATREQARQLIDEDTELNNARYKGYGVDRPSIIQAMADIALAGDHKDTFRALEFFAKGLHGIGVEPVVWRGDDVTGPEPTEVVIHHDFGRLIDKLADVGLLQRGPVAAPRPEDQRLLPARSE